MSKKKIKFIILLTIFILIIAVSSLLLLTSNKDGQKIKDEYEILNGKINDEGKEYPIVNIDKNNIVKYTNSKEIINIINNGKDAVVYFGSPKNLYSRTAIQVLLDTAKETKLKKIYYFNTDIEDNNSNLMNSLSKDLINNNQVHSPLVIFIVDGKIIEYHKDTVYSHSDPYKKLDESQTNGLKEIYRHGISSVIEG